MTTAATGGTTAEADVDSASAGVSDVDQIRSAARRWFDAYHRGDQAEMRAAAGGVPAIADGRVPPSSGSGETVNRTFDNITTRVVGDNALYTARLVETRDGTQRVWFVSQLWSRRAGGWRLAEVRVVDQTALR